MLGDPIMQMNLFQKIADESVFKKDIKHKIIDLKSINKLNIPIILMAG